MAWYYRRLSNRGGVGGLGLIHVLAVSRPGNAFLFVYVEARKATCTIIIRTAGWYLLG
jgi:hypothetical protein